MLGPWNVAFFTPTRSTWFQNLLCKITLCRQTLKAKAQQFLQTDGKEWRVLSVVISENHFSFFFWILNWTWKFRCIVCMSICTTRLTIHGFGSNPIQFHLELKPGSVLLPAFLFPSEMLRLRLVCPLAEGQLRNCNTIRVITLPTLL